MNIDVKNFAISTEEVESGYYYSYLEEGTVPTSPFPKDYYIPSYSDKTANYNPYILFCFSTKLDSKLRTIKDSWSSHFIHKKYKDKVNLYIEIHDGGEFVPITKELKPVIEEMVKESKSNEGHFLLFKPLNNIYYNNTCLPYDWMVSILESIGIPDTLKYVNNDEDSLSPFYLEGGIYVKLNNYINFRSFYHELSFGILKNLVNLYNKGCIRLNSNNDKQFIKRWQLVRDNFNDKNETALYTAKWNNIMFVKI